MNTQMLGEAVDLAEKLQNVLVSTVNKEGVPHVAVAAELACGPPECVTVNAWFCPGTVANLRENPGVSLVVWDAEEDKGYQLVGHVTDMADVGVLDGYDPLMEVFHPMPQVQRELQVHVDRVLRFTHAPHSDEEE